MFKKAIVTVVLIMGLRSADAQLMESFVHQGEVGVSVGAAHYFGDLNPNIKVNRPKIAAGLFFRKQIKYLFIYESRKQFVHPYGQFALSGHHQSAFALFNAIGNYAGHFFRCHHFTFIHG